MDRPRKQNRTFSPAADQCRRLGFDPVADFGFATANVQKLLLLSGQLAAYFNIVQHRPSSRLLVLDEEKRLLLFRFQHSSERSAGQVFWATPGGSVNEGESFEDAAQRELYEEVGIRTDHLGPQITRRIATFALPTGGMVEADERYFLIYSDNISVSDANWTELEREVMTAHHWWSQSELQSATEQIWPENIVEILIDAGVWESVS